MLTYSPEFRLRNRRVDLVKIEKGWCGVSPATQKIIIAAFKVMLPDYKSAVALFWMLPPTVMTHFLPAPHWNQA